MTKKNAKKAVWIIAFVASVIVGSIISGILIVVLGSILVDKTMTD